MKIHLHPSGGNSYRPSFESVHEGDGPSLKIRPLIHIKMIILVMRWIVGTKNFGPLQRVGIVLGGLVRSVRVCLSSCLDKSSLSVFDKRFTRQSIKNSIFASLKEVRSIV